MQQSMFVFMINFRLLSGPTTKPTKHSNFSDKFANSLIDTHTVIVNQIQFFMQLSSEFTSVF